jgi:putative multiple sugar transport system ATP-binding protein
MKILSGIHRYGEYTGEVFYKGEEQRFSSVRDSENKGIAIINQELALFPDLTIFENIFFGHEIMKDRVIDRNRSILESKKYLNRVKLDVNPTIKIRDISVGNQQLVEIAKALSKKADLIILDEPTSSLNEEESKNLLQLLRELKAEGVTLIMISHRLKEVVEIADTITVLRDGETVCSMDAVGKKVNELDIIKNMVGREIENIYPAREKTNPGEKRFEVKNWTVFDPKKKRNIIKEASFFVREGEIVGIAGLMGAGRTELALSVFGNAPGYRIISGDILLHGKKVNIRNPMDALNKGIAYITEDRKRNGLVLIQDIKFNTTLSNLNCLMNGLAINEKEEIIAANKFKNDLDIRATSIKQKVLNLSGGNQQKVSMAKVLFTEPEVLILDEPTRGIDVGAKYEIYLLINQMAARGMSIVMISSELSELIGMCDRIYALSDGRITGQLNQDEFSEHRIMELATNIKENNKYESLN